MTVLELLENTTRYFTRHDVPSARLTIELMLAELMQKTRMQLYLAYDQPVAEPVLDRLRPLVKRRAEGEPLEYLLGAAIFAGNRIEVSPDVLIPRPETEFLLEAVVKRIDPAGLPVLDVGTGSGILALSLAKRFPQLEVIATDISPAALAVARRNAENLGNIRFLESDLLEDKSLPPRFQMIVANLPYIPTGQIDGLMREVRHEPRLALDGGADGLDLIRRLVVQSAGRTRHLALEFGDDQQEGAKTLCLGAGYALIEILPDLTERKEFLSHTIMDKLVVKGGARLKGRVEISGSKNSALPILAATLLTPETCILHNVPDLSDIRFMLEIMSRLGAKVTFENGTVITRAEKVITEVPYDLVRKMRASICVLGPMIARCGQATISEPGGCSIGDRPIDIHLKGLAELGAESHSVGGNVYIPKVNLIGKEIFLGGKFGSTVLGTDNVMMAATRAKGLTIIESAACEPEVRDLAEFLNKMGAKIVGHGTRRIEIEGVDGLGGVEHTIIPDRIEAGTYMVAALITQGDVLLAGADPDHLVNVIDRMKSCGAHLKIEPEGIRVAATRKLSSIDLVTETYPGFPTDMQAQMCALMSVTPGISAITEKIFPSRFMHLSELRRMGSSVELEGATAILHGVDHLSGAPVMASDLRASAALVLAGLVAHGTTEVNRVYHIDRGYEHIDEKLRNLGAEIERVR